jgi:FkbM family methyltransferase
MRYATTGSSSAKRVRSPFTKEPITQAWIDSFDENEVLFDIGANVGMYRVFAAVMRHARIYVFEPEALNYAELNKKIYLNNFHHSCLAYGLALSNFGLGISYHDFKENSWTEDKQFAEDWHVSKDTRRPQGFIGCRVDTLNLRWFADAKSYQDRCRRTGPPGDRRDA